MTLLDKLERRIGWIAVPGLIKVVVGFTALVYLLTYLNPQFLGILHLDPSAVRRGEVWRLFTYVFLPVSAARPGSLLSPLWVVMALMFLWWIGERLEQSWGAFRLTLYCLVGMLGTTAAAFLFRVEATNALLAASLFFAFAWFHPDDVIYVFFILPMKVKWLAWISAGLLVFGFVGSSNLERGAILLSLANYFIFFGPAFFQRARNRQEVGSRRQRFEVQSRSESEPLHRCATCDATEASNPNLEFRVSRDGEEYCLEHLPRMATTAP
ncbi:MAG: rhomboid family intramembrane serine protease [Chthoniobacterales bacterium]